MFLLISGWDSLLVTLFDSYKVLGSGQNIPNPYLLLKDILSSLKVTLD